MFVILGVDTDFDKLHVVLEVSGLLLKNFLDPFSILRWAVDLDGISRIQKRNVYLSKKKNIPFVPIGYPSHQANSESDMSSSS